MRVIYLTPQNKKVPHEHIIEEERILFSGGKEKLEECSKRDNTKVLVPDGLKNYKVLFKKIGYKIEILNWLKKCQYEIQNITNLNEVIKQYTGVVKMIINDPEEKVNSLKTFLSKKENIEVSAEIFEIFPKVIEENYNKVAQKIGIIFKNNFSEIKEIKALDIAANEHYINLVLHNGVIIQLRYKHYFKLNKIMVQYWNCEDKKSKPEYSQSILKDFKIKNFYKFLIDDKEIDRVSMEHKVHEELNNIIKIQILNNI